jgi:hypothetical protein
MSVYLQKNKGWRYDFTRKGDRNTSTYYKTKAAARQAKARKREELENPPPEVAKTLTDMAFLALVNRRLDYVKAYK